MISLLENWVLLTCKVDKIKSNDLRHVWFFSDSEGAPKGPGGPQWFQTENLVCHEKSGVIYFTMGWFHYGKMGYMKGGQRNFWRI